MDRCAGRGLTRSFGAVLALASVVACSGGDEAAETSAPAVTEAEAEAEVADDTDTTPSTTAGDTAPDTTEPPTTEPERPSEPPRLAGLDSIELTTEQQGGGDRPLLEWSPVDGVDVYGVYLYAPDGSTYWTWQGEATSVFVGGESQLPDSMPGPSVADQMTWSVVGFDADFLPVAASDVRPIAP